MKAHIIYDLDGTLYDAHGLHKLYEDVFDLLCGLAREHPISLVTAGDRILQWEKLQACGILPCFSTIVIVPTNEEKLEALSLLTSFHKAPGATVVVGDRVDAEIAYANRLGLISVWVARGKHAERLPKDSSESPTYRIRSLSELPAIIEKIEAAPRV